MKIHDRLPIKELIKRIRCFFLTYRKKNLNFLSHYYFAQAANNPYYTLGTILPDLFRNHHYSWKFRPEKENLLFNDNSDLELLFKGWKHHVQVDAIFHNSAPFRIHTSQLREQLATVFTQLPKRPFFLAHVAYELILDCLLIRNNIVDTDLFYKNLSSCHLKTLDMFMIRLGITETKGFHSFLDNFTTSRYLANYDKPKNLVYALDRIGRRVWVEKFSEKENEDTLTILENVIENLNPEFLEVFKFVEGEIKKGDQL